MKSPGGSGMPPPEEPQGQPQGQPGGLTAAPPSFRSILPQDPNQVAQLGDQPRMEGPAAPPPLLGGGQPPAPQAGGDIDDKKAKLALMIARMQQSKDIGQQRNATMLGGDPSKNIGYTGG